MPKDLLLVTLIFFPFSPATFSFTLRLTDFLILCLSIWDYSQTEATKVCLDNFGNIYLERDFGVIFFFPTTKSRRPWSATSSQSKILFHSWFSHQSWTLETPFKNHDISNLRHLFSSCREFYILTQNSIFFGSLLWEWESWEVRVTAWLLSPFSFERSHFLVLFCLMMENVS